MQDLHYDAALYRSFWQYDDMLLNRLYKEPIPYENKQLVPEEKYYSHSVAKTETDYRKALLSLSFRGLQGKTQVFPIDREHFSRTRITHSLEVMNNASNIYEEIISRAKENAQNKGGLTKEANDTLSDKDFAIIKYALMTSCLLHDAGNPPFGHFGEVVIREWFKFYLNGKAFRTKDKTGLEDDLVFYEGNANSLRIALKGTGLFDGRRMNLTAFTIAALIKYPNSVNHDPAWNNQFKKYNYFRSDETRLNQLFSYTKNQIDLKNGERSRLSFIMEAADDISYVTSDFEDAFRKGKFTVNDVLVFMFDRFNTLQRERTQTDTLMYLSDTRKNCFSLLFMMAYIAGSDHEYEYLIKRIKKGDFREDNLIARNGVVGPSYLSYLTDESSDCSNSKTTIHTFRRALRDYSDFGIDAQQSHQMQETYVNRWVDIVRKWLCFCSAKAISKLETTADNNQEIENELFGDGLMMVHLLKEVLKHFVYDATENAKLNARAQTVISGLLDKFIPAAEKCIQNPGNYDNNPVHPCSLSSADSALISLIPLRYRLDYLESFRDSNYSWNENRQLYELDMMVLDFITSLPDDYAIKLYSELYKAE